MSNKLISLCIDTLTSYDPERVSIDDHLQIVLGRPSSEIEDNSEWIFISEVVTGIIHYEVLIKVVVDGFYAKEEGRSYLRADTNLFNVISYLVMFCLEEIGMNSFKNLVYSQHIGKMHKFLSFLCAKDNLTGWINDELCRVYDREFVKSRIMSPMLRYFSEIVELVHHLSDKLSNRCVTKTTVKQVTEFMPFNLSRPKTRSIPVDVKEVPIIKKSKGVPKTTYNKPIIQDKLSRAFQANRELAEHNLLEAERVQFTCANPEKSEKTQRKIKQIELEKEARLKVSSVKPTPIPATLNKSQPVKLNTAAIFREGARIKKEKEDAEKRLARLEAGEGDISQFNRWQDEMRQRESAERTADIEKKHLDGQLSYEEAIIAKKQYISYKKESVQKICDESKELRKEYFSHKKEEQLEMRRLVEATMAGSQNVRDTRSKLTATKKKIVQQIAEENRELMARALEEEEADKSQKSEFINQIRAMEKVPIIRTNFVDLTETSGQGFISEMSIAELRERLSLMKLAEEEELRERRKVIKITKEVKQHVLNDTVENISSYKEEKLKQAASKQVNKGEKVKTHTAYLKEQKLSDLQDKLENKRRERIRLQQLSSQTCTLSKCEISGSYAPTPLPDIHTKPSKQKYISSSISSKEDKNMFTVVPHTPPVKAIGTLIRASSRT